MATAADLALYRTSSTEIGAVRLFQVRLPPGAMPFVASPDEPGMVSLLLPIDGGAIIRARGGQQYLVGRNDLTWVPSAGNAAVSVARTTTIAVAELSVDVFERHGVQLGNLPPRTHPASPLVQPVRKFLLTAVENDLTVEPISAQLFERMLAEMVESLALEAKGMPAGQGRRRPPLREQAVAHITAFRSDADLSPQHVATCLRVSVRQLQRAFEEAGTTAAGEIRRQRTEAAVGMLSDALFDDLKMPEIAARAGFRNDAEMRRAVSAWMGTTPSQLRDAREKVSP